MRFLIVATVLVACKSSARRPEPNPTATPNTVAPTVPAAAAPLAVGSSAAAAGSGSNTGAGSATTAVASSPPSYDCEADHADAAFDSPWQVVEGKDGYIFRSGKQQLGPYPEAFGFGPRGVAGAVIGNQLHYIDTTGKDLGLAYNFDNGPDEYQEGMLRFRTSGKKVGFLAADHSVAIAATFDDAMRFCKGVATVQLAGKEFEINPKGERVSEPRPAVDRSHHD
ncbi:MAG: hypothetical protein KBG15_08140 [Kofleriaceae bacterium]|nr:hypothetical protein [Kofleriaceae bacterium]